MNQITGVFLFNLFIILLFTVIYANIPRRNFIHLKSDKDLTYLDFMFYSVTIQSGVGLPDITADTELAKFLALVQQLILMSSAFILLQIFYYK